MRRYYATIICLLLALLLSDNSCIAKKEDNKKPKMTPSPTAPPSSPPTRAPVKRASGAPTTRPTITVKPGTVLRKIDDFYVKFESDKPITVNSVTLKQTTEDHFKKTFSTSFNVDSVQIGVGGADLSRRFRRQKARRLEKTEATYLISGDIIFVEDESPKPKEFKDVQETILKDSEFIESLTDSVTGEGVTTVVVSAERPKTPQPPTNTNAPSPKETLTIGGDGGDGGSSVGGTVGGVLGAFAFVGLSALIFVKYKKRGKTDEKEIQEKHRAMPAEFPLIVVEEGKDNGDGDTFEAIMSPMFSVQESEESGSQSGGNFTSPPVTRVKSYASRGFSVSSEYDAYSLDGSAALGAAPNLGDKMLGEVLAMSQYTPASDASSLNNGEYTPGRPKMVRVATGESSVFSYNSAYNFDSPSAMGSVDGVSVAGSGMISESFKAHGRSLTIGDKKTFETDEDHVGKNNISADGIEVAIDPDTSLVLGTPERIAGTPERAEIEVHVATPTIRKEDKRLQNPFSGRALNFLSRDSSDDFKVNINVVESNDPEEEPTIPKVEESPKMSQSKPNLQFAERSPEDFKVNIVETENSEFTEPVPLQNAPTQQARSRRQIELKFPEPVPLHNVPTQQAGSRRQVQRVQKKHKLTITTDRGLPKMVKAIKPQFPTQFMADKSLADADDSSVGSYSSYFSTESESVSALLRNTQDVDDFNPPVIQRRGRGRDRDRNVFVPPSVQPTIRKDMFPIRTIERDQSKQNYYSSTRNKSAANVSPFKQRQVDETMKMKGISSTNYAAEARRNRMARRANTKSTKLQREDSVNESISNQVASLRRARLQSRIKM